MGFDSAMSASFLGLKSYNQCRLKIGAKVAEKHNAATDLLREGLSSGTIRLPHQAIVEFVAATTRPSARGLPLLSLDEARREAEEIMNEFVGLYPTEQVLRLALYGWANRADLKPHAPAF